MEGWIKLHRKITESSLWTKEPFTAGQAWVDLLLLANHKEQKVLLNGSWGVVGRGQILTSTYKLAERWKWSRGKVARFLDVLKMDKMLDIDCSKGGTTNGTTLTIVNYSLYQNRDTTDDTTLDTTDDTTLDTTNGLRTDINKNIKNIKNNIECVYTREENFSEKLLLDQTWIEQMAMQLHNPTGDAEKNIELIARLIQEANLAFQADGDYPHDYSSFRQRCRMYIVRHYKRMLNDLKMLNNNLKSNNYGNTQSCARQIGSDNPDDYRVEWAKY